jgi:hypothetical protein
MTGTVLPGYIFGFVFGYTYGRQKEAERVAVLDAEFEELLRLTKPKAPPASGSHDQPPGPTP